MNQTRRENCAGAGWHTVPGHDLSHGDHDAAGTCVVNDAEPLRDAGRFSASGNPVPAEHRSLTAFTAWSSLVHGAWMGTQALLNMVARGELIGVAVLLVIGIASIALAPGRVARGDS